MGQMDRNCFNNNKLASQFYFHSSTHQHILPHANFSREWIYCTKTVKITTFNVGLLDIRIFGKLIFEFAPDTRARAGRLGASLLAFECDILFIQELYHQDDVLQLKDILKEKFPYSVFSESTSKKVQLSHGLAIFSKFPLSEMQDSRYKTQLIDEGIFGPKGFLLSYIQIPKIGKTLVINTHTSAGGLFQHPEGKKTETCRALQLTQIASLANTTDVNSIIVGDLNCGHDVSQRNFNILMDRGFLPVENLTNNVEIGPTWDPLNTLNINSPHKTSPPQRIDHILISDKLSEIISIKSVSRSFTQELQFENKMHTLSDHYGITVEIF